MQSAVTILGLVAMAHSDEWVVDRQLVCTSFPHLGARSTVK